jgi:hypothetical protein
MATAWLTGPLSTTSVKLDRGPDPDNGPNAMLLSALMIMHFSLLVSMHG